MAHTACSVTGALYKLHSYNKSENKNVVYPLLDYSKFNYHQILLPLARSNMLENGRKAKLDSDPFGIYAKFGRDT